MSKILKTFKTLRTHWKKSTFGAVMFSYVISRAKDRYDTNVLMSVCCKEAERYGEERLPVVSSPRSVTVILNPAANKRSAKADYEKYCEPLLHLAGINVTLLQTNSEGHAKELVKELAEGESVIVAGGDGTLSETITGLLREEQRCQRTVGILPLGRRNLVANQLFPAGAILPKVTQLTDATMAIIKNHAQPKDVMKIEIIEAELDNPGKPIYAVGAIEWGAFRDAYAKRDKYWFYGRFRDYATYIFNGYKSSLSWNCKGTFKYSPPCEGCNNCRTVTVKEIPKGRWLDFIMPKVKEDDLNDKDYREILNQNCGIVEEKCFKTSEVKLTMSNGESQAPPHLSIGLGKMGLGYTEFVSEGWRRVNNKPPTLNEVIKARTLEIHPLTVSTEGEEIWFAIDNEEFDVKPIKITFLPNAIQFYKNNIDK